MLKAAKDTYKTGKEMQDHAEKLENGRQKLMGLKNQVKDTTVGKAVGAKVQKMREGKPTDLYKDGVTGLSKEELFEGKIKYIPYTRVPKVTGVASNVEANEATLRAGARATVLEVFDTHDAINLSTQAQLQGIFTAFDIYSDATFLNALLNHSYYANVTQWKKDIFLMLFCFSQFLWLTAAFGIAWIIGRKLIRKTDQFDRTVMFCKLWLSMALNAPIVKLLQVVSYGTHHFQVSDHYGVVFVAINEIRTAKAEGAMGFIPQSITLVLEDISLLAMNLLITAEIGFTWEATWALLTGALSAAMKTKDIANYWRTVASKEEELIRKRQVVEEREDAYLADEVSYAEQEYEKEDKEDDIEDQSWPDKDHDDLETWGGRDAEPAEEDELAESAYNQRRRERPSPRPSPRPEQREVFEDSGKRDKRRPSKGRSGGKVARSRQMSENSTDSDPSTAKGKVLSSGRNKATGATTGGNTGSDRAARGRAKGKAAGPTGVTF